jgi:hypothetical protein
VDTSFIRQQLETRPPPQQDQDVVYDVHGNVDEAATREARIQGRVRAHNAGGNRAPPDPMLRLNLLYLHFLGVMMLMDILIGR